MSAYAFSVAHGVSQGTRSIGTFICPRRRLRHPARFSDGFLGQQFGATAVSTLERKRVDLTIRCDESEGTLSSTPAASTSEQSWKDKLKPGSVIEVWSRGELRFGLVSSLYEKGVLASFVEVSSDSEMLSADVKVSFGEIIAVWDNSLQPLGRDSAAQLVQDVEAGLRLLKVSIPRSIDLRTAYDEMRRLPKKDLRSIRTSAEVAQWVFPMQTAGSRCRNAARTVATAVLLAADTIRFKRAGAGLGWRALPASVTVARGRCSFVDMCKRILEHKASGSIKQEPMWSRDHLEILRELEIYAASGSAAKGTAATALEALGYEPTDDGAARMLLDIEYWATGTVESNGGGNTQSADAANGKADTASWIDPRFAEISDQEKASEKLRKYKLDRVAQNENSKAQYVRDWTFPPEILAEARELRISARERRLSLCESQSSSSNGKRRNLWHPQDQDPLRVYCIDDKASRFLDDAISVEVLEDGSIVRICIHIADVDEVVKSGSAIDSLARERGQSLYLPLKPLHMLPAAAMDAASFSSVVPNEAITVLVDFDVESEMIRKWEVFASIVPPVTRLNYDQFDAALEDGATAALIQDEDCDNLRVLAKTAPFLAERLDQRRTRRRQKPGGARLNGQASQDEDDQEAKGIASVRLVKRGEKGMGKGIKIAEVVDFRTTGSHVAVGELLTSAGALIRQFARENRVHLPEDRGAARYVARCGTAPLRRYADLAIQRQIKCVLFGRQPAGRRRMDELRLWLAKRQSAGERTVAERRQNALYDSLSNHCSQQRTASGSEHAFVRGQILSVSKTKRGVLRVDVRLDGTGLDTNATISPQLLARIQSNTEISGTDTVGEDERSKWRSDEDGDGMDDVVTRVRAFLKPRSKVRVQVENVDTAARRIRASVVEVLKR